MKPVLLLLASLVLLVLVFLSGVVITAHVIAEPEPHRFAHLDTPDLWTSRPTVIDPAKQAYERLPAATPQVAVADNGTKTANVAGGRAAVDRTVTASVQPQPVAQPLVPAGDIGVGQQGAMVEPEQAQWCHARYRSYRVEDNTYQPYSGGPRRICQAPGATGTQDVAAVSADGMPPASLQNGVQPVSRAPLNDESGQAYGSPDRAEPAYEEPQAVAVSGAEMGAPVGAHEEWCFDRYRSYRVEDNSYQPFDGGPRRACLSPHG